MNRTEIFWSIASILISIIGSAFGHELRTFFNLIPHGYRVARIAQLKIRINRYSGDAFHLYLTTAVTIAIGMLVLVSTWGMAAWIWVSPAGERVKHEVLISVASLTFWMPLQNVVMLFRAVCSQKVIARAERKLSRLQAHIGKSETVSKP
jgi:hypothetical protein